MTSKCRRLKFTAGLILIFFSLNSFFPQPSFASDPALDAGANPYTPVIAYSPEPESSPSVESESGAEVASTEGDSFLMNTAPLQPPTDSDEMEVSGDNTTNESSNESDATNSAMGAIQDPAPGVMTDQLNAMQPSANRDPSACIAIFPPPAECAEDPDDPQWQMIQNVNGNGNLVIIGGGQSNDGWPINGFEVCYGCPGATPMCCNGGDSSCLEMAFNPSNSSCLPNASPSPEQSPVTSYTSSSSVVAASPDAQTFQSPSPEFFSEQQAILVAQPWVGPDDVDQEGLNGPFGLPDPNNNLNLNLQTIEPEQEGLNGPFGLPDPNNNLNLNLQTIEPEQEGLNGPFGLPDPNNNLNLNLQTIEPEQEGLNGPFGLPVPGYTEDDQPVMQYPVPVQGGVPGYTGDDQPTLQAPAPQQGGIPSYTEDDQPVMQYPVPVQGGIPGYIGDDQPTLQAPAPQQGGIPSYTEDDQPVMQYPVPVQGDIPGYIGDDQPTLQAPAPQQGGIPSYTEDDQPVMQYPAPVQGSIPGYMGDDQPTLQAPAPQQGSIPNDNAQKPPYESGRPAPNNTQNPIRTNGNSEVYKMTDGFELTFNLIDRTGFVQGGAVKTNYKDIFIVSCPNTICPQVANEILLGNYLEGENLYQIIGTVTTYEITIDTGLVFIYNEAKRSGMMAEGNEVRQYKNVEIAAWKPEPESPERPNHYPKPTGQDYFDNNLTNFVGQYGYAAVFPYAHGLEFYIYGEVIDSNAIFMEFCEANPTHPYCEAANAQDSGSKDPVVDPPSYNPNSPNPNENSNSNSGANDGTDPVIGGYDPGIIEPQENPDDDYITGGIKPMPSNPPYEESIQENDLWAEEQLFAQEEFLGNDLWNNNLLFAEEEFLGNDPWVEEKQSVEEEFVGNDLWSTDDFMKKYGDREVVENKEEIVVDDPYLDGLSVEKFYSIEQDLTPTVEAILDPAYKPAYFEFMTRLYEKEEQERSKPASYLPVLAAPSNNALKAIEEKTELLTPVQSARSEEKEEISKESVSQKDEVESLQPTAKKALDLLIQEEGILSYEQMTITEVSEKEIDLMGGVMLPLIDYQIELKDVRYAAAGSTVENNNVTTSSVLNPEVAQEEQSERAAREYASYTVGSFPGGSSIMNLATRFMGIATEPAVKLNSEASAPLRLESNSSFASDSAEQKSGNGTPDSEISEQINEQNLNNAEAMPSFPSAIAESPALSTGMTMIPVASPSPSQSPSPVVIPPVIAPRPNPSQTPTPGLPTTADREFDVDNSAIRAALIAQAQAKAENDKSAALANYDRLLKQLVSGFLQTLEAMDSDYFSAKAALEAKNQADVKSTEAAFDIENFEKETNAKLEKLAADRLQALAAIEDEEEASLETLTQGIVDAFARRDELIKRFEEYGRQEEDTATAEYQAAVDRINNDSSLSASEKQALLLAEKESYEKRLADIKETVRIYTENFNEGCEITIRALEAAYRASVEDRKKKTEELETAYAEETQDLKDALKKRQDDLKAALEALKIQFDTDLGALWKETSDQVKALRSRHDAELASAKADYDAAIAAIDKWLNDEIARINAMYP